MVKWKIKKSSEPDPVIVVEHINTKASISRLSDQYKMQTSNIPTRRSLRNKTNEVEAGKIENLTPNPPMDHYNFDQSDSDQLRLRLDLSPEKVIPSPVSQKSSKRLKQNHCDTDNTPEIKHSKNKENLKKTSANLRKTNTQNGRSKVRPASVWPRVGKASQRTFWPQIKSKTPDVQNDSGVFMTPPSLCIDENLSSVDASTSTPSNTRQMISQKKPAPPIVSPVLPRRHLRPRTSDSTTTVTPEIKPKRKAASKKRRGPEPLVDSPMLSPVQKIYTSKLQGQLVTSQSELFMENFLSPSNVSQSDVAQSDVSQSDVAQSDVEELSYKPLDISKTYEGRKSLGSSKKTLIPHQIKSIEKQKKSRSKKKRFSTSRSDVLADLKNQEFEDIDSNYELSID